MPFIRSVSVTGLAGREQQFHADLDEHINVFYGLNGTGKTSLLRIMHSALRNAAGILASIPFNSAELVLHSYANDADYKYEYSVVPGLAESGARKLKGVVIQAPRVEAKWTVTPAHDTPWYHRYLPTWRLYSPPPTTASADSYTNFFLRPSETSEESLESRFAANLTQIWKDYSADVARRVNDAQENGLASILRSVVAISAAEPAYAVGDPKQSYLAVTKFLARRGMQDIALSEQEFSRRYRRNRQLRSVVEDIEKVEEEIKGITAPRDSFVSLVNEMFVRDKSIRITDKELEVAIRNKKIGLNTLSAGEKHLLTIFVETLLTGSGTVIMIDEPELSLHVDWQRRLIGSMRVLNPGAQVILATHSPEIVADLPNHLLHEL